MAEIIPLLPDADYADVGMINSFLLDKGFSPDCICSIFIKCSRNMIIKLNEKPYEVEKGISLFTFLESLNIRKEGIAIAINYQVIPKSAWEQTILTDGQDLMLIHAVSGG